MNKPLRNSDETLSNDEIIALDSIESSEFSDLNCDADFTGDFNL